MRRLHLAWVFLAVLGVGLLLVSRSPMSAQQAGGAIPIDNDDLGGVVTGPKGPEAGVWVIAETSDLPTKFAKIVVTDDRGQYLHPGSAESELQRLGARIRPRRFTQDADGCRQAAEPDRGARAEPARCR